MKSSIEQNALGIEAFFIGTFSPSGRKNGWAQMIKATDSVLTRALNELKRNPELGPRILEIEHAGIEVIINAAPSKPHSQTDPSDPMHQVVFINSKGDDAVARAQWGIAGTSEANSIAHELGHVYFSYLKDVKKKPIPAGPSTQPPESWQGNLSEVMARRFDTYSRPKGTVIPILIHEEPSFFMKLLLSI
jgi:hypothetical protein